MAQLPQKGTEFHPGRRHLNLILPPEEYVLVRDCAKAMGLSMTEFVRRAIRQKVLLDGRIYIECDGEYVQIGGIV